VQAALLHLIMKIELFYNHTGCTHSPHNCSGETYIATVVADNAKAIGRIIPGSIAAGTTITATATTIDSLQTSAFADCFALFVAALPPVAKFTVADSRYLPV